MNFFQFVLHTQKKKIKDRQLALITRNKANGNQFSPSVDYNYQKDSKIMLKVNPFELFETYAQDKLLHEDKYQIDMEDFEYIAFPYEYPEIYFEILYFIFGYKVKEREECEKSYYKNLDLQIKNIEISKRNSFIIL